MAVKRILGVMGGMALIALVGLMIVSTAAAQTATPESQTAPPVPGLKMWGQGFGLGRGGSTAVYDAVAEALNLTPTELFEQLHSGRTLEEIAQAQGVELQVLRDAANSAREQEVKDRIAQAVEDGKITQEQADWMLQGIEKGYVPFGRGFGRGFGRMGRHGGMRGFGGFDTKPAAPDAAPGTSF
jgi:hypothetical protein